ncbi:MAG: hypothetical protein DYG89_31515 [Caldilinea sp. CFX5]|nr:hypothetical protein [Caldilinea sp. CFX5]
MARVKEYHRPDSVTAALTLLGRPGVTSVVLAGGTQITPQLVASDYAADTEVDAVVDLQAVGLTQVECHGDRLTLGAMVRVQTLVETADAPALVREMAQREGPNTLRHVATIGGLVVNGNPESECLAALLLFDAEVQIQSRSGEKRMGLADLLAHGRASLDGGLVTAITITTTGKTASDRVARTPADAPIVAALARQTDDGNVRLALCGVAATPCLVNPDAVAALTPPADFRGSSAYRRQMAVTLSRRVIAQITGA